MDIPTRLLIPLLVIIFILLILVIIIRWVLRINVIVSNLEKVNENIKLLKTPWHQCESCKTIAPRNHFIKIDSGQYICDDCRRKMAAYQDSK